jgi:tRNA (guanine-N7-)-methyltransferase
MPHISFKAKKNSTFVEDNVFLFKTKPYNGVSKIAVDYKNKLFLLSLKEKGDDNYILKVDKTTRISPIDIIKTAINKYVDKIDGDIIFSNTSISTHKLEEDTYLKDISYFVNQFQTDKDIWIEIGFGSGRHLLYQAKTNKDKLIIGIEIHKPSIEQVIKQIKLQKLTNVLILDYDARLFMEFLPSNSVERIFVHFPVPWDKKPHRRVYSKEFINESIRVLKVDGSLELRTDSINYFQYSLELLTNLNSAHIEIDINKSLDITSKYEDRWLRQNKNIYDIKLCNNTTSDIKNLDFEFNFNQNIDIISLKSKLELKKPIVQEDFVVNFGKIYDINDRDFLIEVVMGSCNKPLNKYIIVRQNSIKYFQSNPIPTSTNIKAHRLIDRIFYDN